ncbi:MAG: nitroreductase family protein [Dehalococcoidia bacterium]
MDFFEVIRTQRAMRRLLPDPVSDDEIWQLLDAAIRAPSGGNRQPWNFLVVRDPALKEKIGVWYLDAWQRMYGPAANAMQADPAMARTFRSADHLARHLAEAPVLIIATIRKEMPVTAYPTLGASVYPAVQNLMLAARALGLGTTLTTLHKLHEGEVKELLGIPDDVETMALIPVGRPKGKFAEAARLPVEKVTYWDHWGATKQR